MLSGDQAFLLHDTWGFPIDLTLEMAAEQGLSVDEDGFRRLMKEQRDRAKADARAKKGAHADVSAYREVADALGAPVEFTGYTEVDSEATVVGLLRRRRAVASRQRGRRGRARPRPHPVLRRGRRPARRPRPHRARPTAPSSRSATCSSRSPGSSCTRATSRSARSPSGLEAHVAGRPRAPARRSPAPTPPRTWPTRRCATRSARPPTQAGSENSPGRFRFDSRPPAPCPAAVLTDVEQQINDVLLATSTCTPRS